MAGRQWTQQRNAQLQIGALTLVDEVVSKRQVVLPFITPFFVSIDNTRTYITTGILSCYCYSWLPYCYGASRINHIKLSYNWASEASEIKSLLAKSEQ